MFELIMFDLDGTLVDSRRDIALAVNLALDEMGAPTREAEEIFSKIGGGVHNLLRDTLPPTRDDLVECGVDLFWDFYNDHVLDTTRLYPGVYKMLEGLGGRKMAVVTNKPHNHTMKALVGLDIDRYFISVQGWKMGIKVKPDPDMINRALDEAGVRPENALMIGDGVQDIRAAEAAGVRSCAVGYGYSDVDRLKDANPDLFAMTVSDIADLLE